MKREPDYIVLLNEMSEYLTRLHRDGKYHCIQPGEIQLTGKGTWRISGNSGSSGTVSGDIRHMGGTLYYLITGTRPAIDFFLDGMPSFSEKQCADYPARFLRILEKTLLLPGQGGYETDHSLSYDLAALTREMANTGPGNRLSAADVLGWRYTRNREQESGEARYSSSRRYCRLRWARKLSERVYGTPWVHDTSVFLAMKNGALESIDCGSGETIWRSQLKSGIESSPVLAGQTCYFGSDDGILYGVDMLTGGIVSRRALGSGMIRSSPLIARDRLLVGTASNEFYCLNLADLGTVWVFTCGDRIFSGAVTDGKQLWFGSDDGHIYALRLSDGVQVWKFRTEGKVRSTPEYADETIFAGSFDGYLYALHAGTGQPVWKVRTRDRIFSSPVMCDGGVCVGSNDGSVYMVSTSDGRTVWKRKTSAPVASSPLVLSKTVYIGNDAGELMAFDKFSGKRVMCARTGSRQRASVLWNDGALYVASTDQLRCYWVKGV